MGQVDVDADVLGGLAAGLRAIELGLLYGSGCSLIRGEPFLMNNVKSLGDIAESLEMLAGLKSK